MSEGEISVAVNKIIKLKARIRRLDKALKFYAEEKYHSGVSASLPHPPKVIEFGEIAREARRGEG